MPHRRRSGLERVVAAPDASRSRDLDGDGLVLVSDLTDASRAWDAARETGVLRARRRSSTASGCAGRLRRRARRARSRPRPFTLIPAADGLFVVDSTADDADATPGDAICQTVAGACTLRAAMTEATRHPGADTIAFNLPGSGPQTIQIPTQLPTLSDTTGPTTIDGYTQPGSSPNTSATVDNAVILVQVRGTGATLAYYMMRDHLAGQRGAGPLDLQRPADGDPERECARQPHRRQFRRHGRRRDRSPSGRCSATAPASSSIAVPPRITSAMSTPAERNVISGSPFTGVYFTDSGTNANFVQNNIIGLNPSRDEPHPQHEDGRRHQLRRLATTSSAGPARASATSSPATPAGASRYRTPPPPAATGCINNFIGTDVTGNAGPELHAQQRAGRPYRGRRAEHAHQRQRDRRTTSSAGIVVNGVLTAGTRTRGQPHRRLPERHGDRQRHRGDRSSPRRAC